MLINMRIRVQHRYVMVAMLFATLSLAIAIRVMFTIVLTQIVYVPNISQHASANATDVLICPVKNSAVLDTNSSSIVVTQNDNSERKQWSQQLQGFILSAFSIGTLVSEIPGSMIVQKFGAKRVLIVSNLLSAIALALTPLAILYGDFYGAILARIILGFLQGPVFPCLSAFVAPWYPLKQRATLCSLGYIGLSAGGVLGIYASGTLIHYLGRWDIVFYFFVAILVLWWIAFSFLCYDHPDKSPHISDFEKAYLNSESGDIHKSAELKSTPWAAILKTPAVYSLIFSTVMYGCSFQIINTDLPKYLNDVLHVSISDNGLYSAIPRVLSVFVSIGSGVVADVLQNRLNIDRTNVRKLFVILTSVIPATFLMLASYAGCDEPLAVTFLIIAISGHGLNAAGGAINLFDLTPNYAAQLDAIINTAATVFGFLAPYAVGLLTPNALLSEWRVVFWCTFALHIAEAVVFSIFGSGKVQPWNAPKQ